MSFRLLFTALIFLSSFTAFAQTPDTYTVRNAHSHNDYEQNIPFYKAYYQQFGSVEADVFLRNDTLYVAHERKAMAAGRTLQSLYLDPIKAVVQKHHGNVFPNSDASLQLLIDLKTESEPTMKALEKQLASYADMLVPKGKVQVVLSGNTPKPENFNKYADYLFFDGRPGIDYTADQLKRVGLISQSFTNYTKWNGKGLIVKDEMAKIQKMIADAHSMGKKVRLWATPDNVNSWKTLMNLKVDYLNTDHIEELGNYLKNRKNAEYTNPTKHAVYQPTYKNNDKLSKVKNVILLIGDGMGLAQIYAGVTANGGLLNLSRFLNIGFSKNNSSDSYITDSAAGGTAMATGQKTRNRAIGVDSTLKPVKNLPDFLAPLGIQSGLISAGSITDATPAAFFGHQPLREMEQQIAHDFLKSNVQALIGGGAQYFNKNGIADSLKIKGYQVSNQWSDLNSLKLPYILLDDSKTVSIQKGRGNFLTASFDKLSKDLSKNKNGFFMMAEGAQIDYGGHANQVPYVVTEMLDFDQLIGEAVKFADANGETLVIVTADHETGGLTLLDGDFQKGSVDGAFSTNDHTSVMVPVFAYGPHSMEFRGIYENTEIFNRILKIMRQYHEK